MGCFAGSGGHNEIVPGANSQYGIEHIEDRRFLDAVASYVQAAGWKYVNCSDEVGTTKYDVWNNAANNHLRVADSTVDLQFHLNATPGGTGCEVWLHPSYGNRELAANISKAMANAFGLRDRGIKFSTELGWINKTKTGLLPEICFIDNEEDMNKYRANFDKAAKAVAEVIIGRTINPPLPEDKDTRTNALLPSDWQTSNLGFLTCLERQSWVYREPNESAQVVGKIPLGSKHVYLKTAWDGKRFWFQIANDNWVPESAMHIEKDGRSKGVIWNEWAGLECYHHANYNSGIRDRVGIGQWEVELRDNNWIYIKDKGWIEFDEKVIRWIR
ncbi:N-acetylmuramoyl-L-alanine amidase [Bacillus wiedmannii]|uniref:N-acetylmuramoyl-L-alanine amidase n=1 Tax=Bacillus wiedmannii TaxID=1890302 RepID=UPI000BF456DC|nr:N-acetylmuramoyl-L-alanine amidase [Bacillus wiedmannii]PGC72634.1 glycoside hydrolase family 25 [Bacillus wiedmannii]